MRETSRDYGHPYRPWPLRLAHALLRPVAPWVLPPFDPARIVATALRSEPAADGPDPFGDPDVTGPLTVLCASIRDEARLHPVGHLVTHARLVGTLRTRLRARALRAADPGIDAEPVTAPIVITGLQRTGTTLLHRLLGSDPRLRALRSWEGLAPIPRRPAPPGAPDPRIRDARRAERGLAWMAPDFFAVHPVQADALEEEVLLLDLSLLSTVPEATLRVPSYSAWLERQDQAPAYRTLRTFLRHLSHQEGAGRRWLLKTPHHLEWLDTLLDTFPDARVVHTHRDPAATLPSFCSMVAHGRGVMSDSVDPLEVGRDWGRKVERMVTRALDVRDARPGTPVLDVRYDELMADPLATLQRVYTFVDLPFTDADRARAQAALTASPQHRFGRHVYDAADFGMSRDGIRERFARYVHRFDL